MIFVGDVAIASGDCFEFRGFPQRIREVPLCLNLEGAVLNPDDSRPSYGVYNWHQWVDSFNTWELGAAFLGNNHIHDANNGIVKTLDFLKSRRVLAFGAGADLDAACLAPELHSGDYRYRLLGFGWPVIGCVSARRNAPGVSPLEEYQVTSVTKQVLREDQRARLVVVMHGNYEFERYPQPAHRKLAKSLIDMGVYSVVFHHPHIVGPVERYKGRTIAYSLGNWAFSYGHFFGKKLCFPESSFYQIAVEFGDQGDFIHHAVFDPPSTVCYQSTESVSAEQFSLQAAFEGFSDREYVHWFKKNRVKHKGLPIYYDSTSSPSNWARDRWVGLRQILIDSAVRSGLKSVRRAS
jgi:hypothetical protein